MSRINKFLPLFVALSMIGKGSSAESRLPVKVRQEVLQTHNIWRAKVGVGPLTWAAELANDAQRWADALATNKACQMVHSPAVTRRNAGENLYWASPVRWSDGRVELQNVPAANVVDAWGKERDDYDPKRNECRAGAVCGHYTQIVWRKTREVGCAMRQCPDKSQIWVCRYRPAGNWIGERPY